MAQNIDWDKGSYSEPSGPEPDWDSGTYSEPAKPRTRGLFETANDAVIELANAAAGGVSALANFVNPGNAVSGFIDENIIKAGEEKQSDVVRAEKQRLSHGLQNAQGIGDEIGTVGSYVLNSPLLAASQAAGSFALPGGAVKGAGMAAKALGSGIKGVETAGRVGGIAAGAAMAGGDAAGTAYDMSSKAGATEEQAIAAGRQASVIPALVGGVTGAFGAERLLAGAKGFGGNALSRGLKSGLSEAGQEALEEGVTQFEGQRAAMPYDATIDPTKGVAGAAAMGGIMGFGPGAVLGAMGGGPDLPSKQMGIDPNAGPLSRAAASAVDSQPVPQLGFSPLAGTPIIYPDGSVALNSEQEFQKRNPGVQQDMDMSKVAQPSQPLAAEKKVGQPVVYEQKDAVLKESAPVAPVSESVPLEQRSLDELRQAFRSAQDPAIRKTLAAEIRKRREAMPDPLAPVQQTQQEIALEPQTPETVQSQPQEAQAEPARPIAFGQPLTDAGTNLLGRDANPLQSIIQGQADERRAADELRTSDVPGTGAGSDIAGAGVEPELGAVRGRGTDAAINQPAAAGDAGSGVRGAAGGADALRPDNWRGNAIKAGKVARSLGLDPKGKRLKEIVAEIDAVDAGSGVAAKPFSREQAIRDAWRKEPRTIGKWTPISVEAEGQKADMLVNQKRAGGDKDGALHVVNIRMGKMLKDMEREPIAYTFRLTSDNKLVEEGAPSVATPGQIAAWKGAGFALDDKQANVQNPPSQPARTEAKATPVEAAAPARGDAAQAGGVPAARDTAVMESDGVDKAALEEKRQMLADMIETKKSNREAIPDAWVKRMSELSAQIRGDKVDDGAVYSLEVEGHPMFDGPVVLRNLIPIKVTDATTAQRRLDQALDLQKNVETEFYSASRALSIAKSAKEKTAANLRLQKLRNQGWDEDAIEALRNVTIKELSRLVDVAAEKFGGVPATRQDAGVRADGVRTASKKAKTPVVMGPAMRAALESVGLDPDAPVDKAAKLRRDANKLAEEARKMLDGIVPGQPVMSTRDRNLRERSGEKMRKAGEMLAEADRLDAEKEKPAAQAEKPASELTRDELIEKGRSDFAAGVERQTGVKAAGYRFEEWLQGWNEAKADAEAKAAGKVAVPSDFPLQEVTGSYSGISHSGAGRARMDRDAFVERVQSVYDDAKALAKTKAQQAALDQAIQTYKDEYIKQTLSLARVRSGTYSAFVAGRAKINTRQADSRNSALDKAIDRFTAWDKEAAPKVKAAVLAARTADEVAAEQAEKDAAQAAKQEKRQKSDMDLMRKIIAVKDGQTFELAGMVATKLSNDKDGYPLTLTIKAKDGSPLVNDKLNLATEVFGRRGVEGAKIGRQKIRELVDAIRSEKPAEDDAFMGVEDAPIFYSALRKEIEGLNLKSAPFLGWHGQLQGLVRAGKVKADELEWTGISEWLKLQTGKVSKEDVLAYLDANGVQVTETVLRSTRSEAEGMNIPAMSRQELADAYREMVGYDPTEDDPSISTEELRGMVSEVYSEPEAAETGETKYSQYTLPGGENYREVLLTLPSKENVSVTYTVEQARSGDWVVKEDGKVVGNYGDDKALAESEAEDNRQRTKNGARELPKYKSSHWEQSNVLAHIRVNDRTDAQGRKVLFVEEIQSDWGQDGKKKGFAEKVEVKTISVTGEELTVQQFLDGMGADAKDWLDGRNAMKEDLGEPALKPSDKLYSLFENGKRVMVTDRLQGSLDSMIAKRQARVNAQAAFEAREAAARNASKIPAAPFVDKTDKWLALALKRIMKMAVDGGYDAVAFVNGEQSAERYDLSKQVDSVRVAVKPDTGRYMVFVTQKGDRNPQRMTERDGIEADKLPDMIGKELAERAVNDIKAGKSAEYAGLDLKVGGAGMRSFYDRIVPAAVKDVLKKVGGGQMESVEIDAGSPSENRWLAFNHSIRGSRKEFDSKQQAENYAKSQGWDDADTDISPIGMSPQPGFIITDSMREKVAGGLPLFAGSKSKSRGTGTPTDRAVMDMAGEGKSADEILRFIANTSKSKFNRQVANLLRRTKANPAVSLGGDMGSKDGYKNLALYSRKDHEIKLAQEAEYKAEQIFLHEAIHSATLLALDKQTLFGAQMSRLYESVKEQGLADEYGMKNVGEFVAEAMSNKEFQRLLKGYKAPRKEVSDMSLWERFVSIVRRILGMSEKSQDALSAALELGVQVMRENMPLRAARSFRAEDGPVFAGRATSPVMTEEQAIANGFTMKAYRGVSKASPFNDTGTTWLTTSREVAEVYAEEVMGYDDPGVIEVMVNPSALPRHDASRLTDEQREQMQADGFGNPQAIGIYDRSDDHPLGGSRRNVTVIHAPMNAVAIIGDAPAFAGSMKSMPDNQAPGPQGDAQQGANKGNAVIKNLPSMIGKYPVLDKTLADFKADPESFVEWLTDTLGDDGADFTSHDGERAVGIRGIPSKNELGKNPRRSWQTRDDEKPYRLEGTSTIGISYDYSYAGYDQLLENSKRALELVDGYGRVTKYYAVVIGGNSRQNRLGEANDIGETLISNPKIVAYIRESSNDQSAPDTDGAYFGIADAVEQIKAFDVKSAPKSAWAHYRGMALQALGRRQLVDLYGDEFGPHLKQYDYLVQQMDAEKNETGAEADDIAQRWGKLKDEKVLAELMHDATLAKMDPDKPMPAGYSKAEYDKLKTRFNTLSPDAKTLYREARDMYVAHYKAVQQAIKDRIERSEMSPSEKKRMMAQLDDKLFKELEGVYFPLARFGQYVIVVKDANGQVVNVTRAETVKEGEQARKELQKAFPASSGNTVGKVLKQAEFNAGRDAVGKGFMADLMNALDEKGVDDELRDTVAQLYLSSLPDLSWAKHGIHRKGTPGFSQDARRAFAQNAFHGARYLAKLRYSDQLQDELAGMQEYVKAFEGVEEYDSIQGQQVVDEMVKRHEWLMNPKASPVSTALTSFGFLFHMGLSPASAMVNLTQTALVAYPQMGAKWGFTKAGAALTKASEEVVRAKNDLSQVLKGDELDAFNSAVKDGTIDVTMAHDLAGIAQGEDQGVMWKVRPVMRWASFMFHHAEKFNRQATFLAAYRLAKEANPAATQSQLYEQAKQATYDGHFDYSACVDDATEILTATGWKMRKDLKAGDMAIATDASGRAVQSKVLAVNVYEGDREVIEFKSSTRFSMVLTPNHDAVIQSYNSRPKKWSAIRKVRADSIKNHHFILRTPLAPLEKIDGAYGEDFAALLGWVAAEGWYAKYRKTTAATDVRIGQSVTHNPEYVAEIRGILERLGGEFKEYTYERSRDVLTTFVLRRSLGRRIQECMPEKVLTPELVKSMGTSEMRAFLMAFLKGDGSRYENGRAWMVGQKNGANLDLLQAMATMCGMRSTLSPVNGNGLATLYVVHDDTGARSHVRPLEQIRRTEPLVWCPTTEHGTWIARRNGAVFVTGNSNRARMMQGNWQRVILLFKQYSQAMVYTLARNAYLSVKAMDPKERTQARKTLGGILAAHAAAAGVLGLPIVGPLLTVASWIGGDDDEPWDAEVAMQNAMAELLGPKAAEVMARGLSRLTPFDLSGRVALNKLILPDVQEGLEGKELAESAMAAALGPVAGIGVNVARGVQKITDGDYMRGLEDMMPTAIRGPIRAIRYNMEGAQDRTGITITDDVSLAGEIGQASGFAPSQVRRDTERRSAIYSYDRALTERRAVLMRMMAEARIRGDVEAQAEIQKDIQRFNEKNPTRRITPMNIAQSVRNRRKRVEQAEQGVFLPKNRRDALDAVAF